MKNYIKSQLELAVQSMRTSFGNRNRAQFDDDVTMFNKFYSQAREYHQDQDIRELKLNYDNMLAKLNKELKELE